MTVEGNGRGRTNAYIKGSGIDVGADIDKEKLAESAKTYGKSPYGEHLKAVADGRVRY